MILAFLHRRSLIDSLWRTVLASGLQRQGAIWNLGMSSVPTFPFLENPSWVAWRNFWEERHRTRLDPFRLDRAADDSLDWHGSGVGVTRQRIWLNDLPEGFRGFRILQISDIHHSLFFPLERVAAVVELCNRLKPDLVALTGDFVTYSRDSIDPVCEVLGGIEAPAGVVAVLGNHDFRVDPGGVERALRRRRIEVLRNRHICVRDGGNALFVAGVDDFRYGADVELAVRGIPGNAATVLLAHNPRLVSLAACYGVSLVLSGHTHGGQVDLPLLGTVYGRSAEQMRFKRGWDRFGSTQIYVSRGIGTVVLPWRFRCPAEIPELELQPHHSSEMSHRAGSKSASPSDGSWLSHRAN
jgi:predicted MPP superfamily phosphohydrolase